MSVQPGGEGLGRETGLADFVAVGIYVPDHDGERCRHPDHVIFLSSCSPVPHPGPGLGRRPTVQAWPPLDATAIVATWSMCLHGSRALRVKCVETVEKRMGACATRLAIISPETAQSVQRFRPTGLLQAQRGADAASAVSGELSCGDSV